MYCLWIDRKYKSNNLLIVHESDISHEISKNHLNISLVHQPLSGVCEGYPTNQETNCLDNSVLQALGLIENRSAQGFQPPSPLRSSFGSTQGIYTPYNYQSAELLQRLQALGGYNPQSYTPYSSYASSYPPFQYPVYNPQPVPTVNPQVNSYTLQPPPQKKLPPSPLAVRHPSPQGMSGGGSPLVERRSPMEEEKTSNRSSTSQDSEPQFIKPLSQVGTLTTTDVDGRVRVIVPVPSGAEDAGDLLRALRMREDEVPRPIQRSISEKVPNRSELMSQVQRTAWARHTTKWYITNVFMKLVYWYLMPKESDFTGGNIILKMM